MELSAFADGWAVGVRERNILRTTLRLLSRATVMMKFLFLKKRIKFYFLVGTACRARNFILVHVLIVIPPDTQMGILRGSWIDESEVQE